MSELNESQKIDALLALRQAAWSRVESHQTFEWRVCISLWTALASFTAIVLQHGGASEYLPLFALYVLTLFLAGILAAIVQLHWRWLQGFVRGQYIDLNIWYEYRDEIHKLLEWDFPTELRDKIDVLKEDQRKLEVQLEEALRQETQPRSAIALPTWGHHRSGRCRGTGIVGIPDRKGAE